MKKITSSEKEILFTALKQRFVKNKQRHKGIDWDHVLQRMEANPRKLASLFAMEETGGEPDVVGFDKKTGEFIFYDCSMESPKERRSLCYDHEALEKRKENKPANSATEMSKEIGIEMLNEEEYRFLQSIGEFDLKTSSWVKTPESIRKLGGAVYCDRRYNQVFLGHNGADSYFASRGFRGVLRI